MVRSPGQEDQRELDVPDLSAELPAGQGPVHISLVGSSVQVGPRRAGLSPGQAGDRGAGRHLAPTLSLPPAPHTGQFHHHQGRDLHTITLMNENNDKPDDDDDNG